MCKRGCNCTPTTLTTRGMCPSVIPLSPACLPAAAAPPHPMSFYRPACAPVFPTKPDIALTHAPIFGPRPCLRRLNVRHVGGGGQIIDVSDSGVQHGGEMEIDLAVQARWSSDGSACDTSAMTVAAGRATDELDREHEIREVRSTSNFELRFASFWTMSWSCSTAFLCHFHTPCDVPYVAPMLM